AFVQLVLVFWACVSCVGFLLEVRQWVLCAENGGTSCGVGAVRLNLNEGLTGWVARERRLLAISREAYNDSRFKTFAELEADTFEAFLSAPVMARSRVVGVINVQHREPHAYTGDEMELLTTVGEQVGCLLMLAAGAGQGKG
ncbi:MAG: GAF domain-containing protein, partial [Acidobacteriota bacterium]